MRWQNFCSTQLQIKVEVSRKKMAEEKAFAEYDTFNKFQKIESDFDKELKKVLKG